MPFDVVVVADKARISLAAALNILISRKTCPEANFTVAIPEDYLLRPVPTAVPEHGLHVYPWEELYSTLGLRFPEIKVLCAGGEVGAPWLNAGFVVCPDGSRLGGLWHRACRFILHCHWV